MLGAVFWDGRDRPTGTNQNRTVCVQHAQNDLVAEATATGSRGTSPGAAKRMLDAQVAGDHEAADDAVRGRRRMLEAIGRCQPMHALCYG